MGEKKPIEKSRPKAKLTHVAGLALPAAGDVRDNLLHDRVRLGVVSALAVNDALSFVELKRLLELSDGNLSVHARKLEAAEFITCTKGFDGRVPRTEFRLTANGRRALERHLDHLERLIRTVRKR